jgi:hypothetical protein
MLAILKEVQTFVYISIISWLLPTQWLQQETITKPMLVIRSIVKKFPKVLQSIAWVYNLLIVGIAGSIHSQGMNVCLLCLLCVV